MERLTSDKIALYWFIVGMVTGALLIGTLMNTASAKTFTMPITIDGTGYAFHLHVHSDHCVKGVCEVEGSYKVHIPASKLAGLKAHGVEDLAITRFEQCNLSVSKEILHCDIQSQITKGK